MLTRTDFENKLLAIIRSVPGLEQSPACFTDKINPVCRAVYYKVGMGLPGQALLEIRDKVMLMLSEMGSQSPLRTVSFEIEGDPLSSDYGKTYVNIRHLHFSRQMMPLPAPSAKVFEGIDLMVAEIVSGKTMKVVVFRPHWPDKDKFGMPIKVLHNLLDKDGQILINHQDCTHEGIDRLTLGDIVTIPRQVEQG